MVAGKRGHGIWTPANVVTCVRVVLVPVWAALALWVGPVVVSGGSVEAGVGVAVLFALLSATDKLDGYLARSRGEVTTFGKFLDPIADKLLVVAALLVLLAWDLVSPWVPIVVVAREFLVSGLRMVVATSGTVVAASNLGKWKTATTMVSIVALLLSVALPFGSAAVAIQLAGYTLLAVAVVLTVWSGVDYFWKSREALFADEGYEGSPEHGAAAMFGSIAGAGEALPGVASEGAVTAAPTWDDCVRVAARVLEGARERGLTVGTAESCTGGLIEGALTAVPGSSDVVMGAVGSYAVSVKHHVLGVSEDVLGSVGPVSPECAAQMAEGARPALGCDVSVSVTGIAGPGGAEPDKPVGLVWFGVSDGVKTHTESEVFPGDRDEVRLRAVVHALELLERTCSGHALHE